jgi:hypothetical protein
MLIGEIIGQTGIIKNIWGCNMAYTYKFLPASLYAGAQKGASPKDQYTELFQKTLDEQFYNSSDWWTIQEETAIGSAMYENTDVRINHVINAETGLKLGDDWKTVLFPDLNHQLDLGRRYIFNNSVWMIINIEVIKNIAATCTIRRCNNTLRWIDEPTGIYYEEPCSIEYEIKEPRDYITQGSPFPTPGGFLKIYTQFNDRTKNINENQRFLFGNPGHWTCYKVTGTGINDFTNVATYDNNSAHILTLDMSANFINKELDDIVNGIADVHTNIYHVVLSSGSISGSPTGIMPLRANITYNGDSVTRTMEWISSDSRIASVSGSSGSALVTFNTNGSCTITASVYGNPASDTCWITVSASPTMNNEILISPNMNYVLEGNERIYSVYLYENGIQSSGSFAITCNGNTVPSTSYIFIQTDGNHFKVTNILKDLTSHLTVQCTTGSIVTPKAFNIYLRGAWLFDTI